RIRPVSQRPFDACGSFDLPRMPKTMAPAGKKRCSTEPTHGIMTIQPPRKLMIPRTSETMLRIGAFLPTPAAGAAGAAGYGVGSGLTGGVMSDIRGGSLAKYVNSVPMLTPF